MSNHVRIRSWFENIIQIINNKREQFQGAIIELRWEWDSCFLNYEMTKKTDVAVSSKPVILDIIYNVIECLYIMLYSAPTDHECSRSLYTHGSSNCSLQLVHSITINLNNGEFMHISSSYEVLV